MASKATAALATLLDGEPENIRLRAVARRDPVEYWPNGLRRLGSSAAASMALAVLSLPGRMRSPLYGPADEAESAAADSAAAELRAELALPSGPLDVATLAERFALPVPSALRLAERHRVASPIVT